MAWLHYGRARAGPSFVPVHKELCGALRAESAARFWKLFDQRLISTRATRIGVRIGCIAALCYIIPKEHPFRPRRTNNLLSRPVSINRIKLLFLLAAALSGCATASPRIGEGEL